ncbi:MAG TPA: inositol monophosphatase family protein [Pyrinomonadaceae bacterium]|nr:inositol monophosphatase family protein [Pyrinomonadaceae bacterium]
MREELRELLNTAKYAASQAARVHRSAIQLGQLDVSSKASSTDLVTEVDREAEQALVTAILATRASDSIVGEEGTNHQGTSGVRWILDPLDGTTNFVHGYPAHSVAVGIEINGERRVGVVHDTFSNRVYAAVVGEGATYDDAPIVVRSEDKLERALVGTGFLPDAGVRRLQAELLREVLPRVRDIRRSGCPSLDICNVASGKLDVFYECGLGPWDICAAAAIAEAAGATVRLLASQVLPNPLLVVANPKLISTFVSLLEKVGVTQ